MNSLTWKKFTQLIGNPFNIWICIMQIFGNRFFNRAVHITKRTDCTFNLLPSVFEEINPYTTTNGEWNGNLIGLFIGNHCFPVTIINRVVLYYDSIPHKRLGYTNPKKGGLYLFLSLGRAINHFHTICKAKPTLQCSVYFLRPSERHTLNEISGNREFISVSSP